MLPIFIHQKLPHAKKRSYMSTAHPLVAAMDATPIIDNSLAIWGLGQMGVAVKGPDAILYIDPCLSDVVRIQFGDFWTRAYPPPMQPQAITNADFYMVTHEHLDHLDPMTAGPAAAASPNAKLVGPAWCDDIWQELNVDAGRIIHPQALTSIALPGTSARITAVPGAHYAKEHDPHKGYRWIGYLIEWNGVTFYHAGDTIIYEDYIATLKQLPTPDIAMLPINGRDYYRETEAGAVGNLLPAEAGRLAHDLGWKVLIIGHNDLYTNNAIPMHDVVEGLLAVNPRQQYKQLQPGELYYYVKPAI
jgi:L-ascorbate 6-phosphate lactonase